MDMRERYRRFVLRLLTRCFQRVAFAWFEAGHKAGIDEYRAHMQRDLEALHAACAEQRTNDYTRGFLAAMREMNGVPCEADAQASEVRH